MRRRWYKLWLWVRRDSRWSIQRARRGWSDLDQWNMGGYLTRLIVEMTAQLRANHAGYPGYMTDKEWQAILLDIETGFRAAQKCWDETYYLTDDEIKAFKRAQKLLARHWFEFWD